MIRTVIHFTDSHTFGGTEQVLLHTLAGLDRQHWRPVLFHHPEPGIKPLLDKAQKFNVKLQTVPRIRTIRDIRRLLQFIRALRTECPVIFHAHLTWPLSCKYGLVAAILARTPAIVATAQLYVDPWELPKKCFLYAQPRIIATGIDRYLAVSQAVALQLCHSFHIPAKKIELVPNGIPLATFNRSTNIRLRAALTQDPKRPIVLTVARLDKQKGHRYLIEAATHVPEAIFVLAGEGPDRVMLEAQASALGVDDRIVFLGYREDIPDLLACCDLFVLPSLYEGLPLSILEAMAAGKPVIASAIGGNNEVITHGETGLLVPPADSISLARAMQRLLSDSVLAQRLATAGKVHVYQKFSAETMVRRVTQIYDELLNT